MVIRKKKLCFITTVSSTLEGFVLPLIKYLIKEEDWEIYMICSEDKAFSDLLPEKVNYIPVSMKRGINFDGFKATLEMIKIFKREGFDIIQYSTPNASLYASLAGKFAKVPVRLYCQWGMAFVGMKGVKRKIFKTIEKIVCCLSTCIEPDSKSNLDFAHKEKLYPIKKGKVIGNGSACGVDLDKFNIKSRDINKEFIREKLNIPQDAFVFGFVGRITRDKGINELLLASREFLKMFSNVYFLNLGGEDGIETLNKELYDWSLLSNNIIYTGFVDDVEKYLAAMDCYILPSYREGFGMGVIEAEAMELPVIVTDIPGPIDAMENNTTGKLINKGDWKSLYDAMVEMYELPAMERRKMGERGRVFVIENFEQKRLCKLIIDDRKNLCKEIGIK